jgi:pilus assembly protein CpaE
MKSNLQAAETMDAASAPAEREDHIAPAPRVSIQAFCTSVETAGSAQAAAEDRRMAKAHLRVQMGGIAAAIEAYRNSPTPNVIMIETDSTSFRRSATRARALSWSAASTTLACTAS